MVGQIILGFIIVGSFAFLFKVVYDAHRKEKWFKSLKPGDKIMVWIYSEYCECMREAVVTKPADGKYIEAEVIELDKCKLCSELNSKNKEGKETCWYTMTKFVKNDIGLKN